MRRRIVRRLARRLLAATLGDLEAVRRTIERNHIECRLSHEEHQLLSRLHRRVHALLLRHAVHLHHHPTWLTRNATTPDYSEVAPGQTRL